MYPKLKQSIDAIINAYQSKQPTNVFVVDYLNINYLNENVSRCLNDVMDVFGLYNVIYTPTCYKSLNPTLFDIILTSQKLEITSTINVTIRISNFHNLVTCSTKCMCGKIEKKSLIIEITHI